MNAFADKVHSRDSLGKRRLEADDVSAAARAIGEDAALVTHELQMCVLAGRSRLALVRWYAARCEGFDAKELRAAVLGALGSVERELLCLLQSTFSAGAHTVVGRNVGGLRPDVLDAAPAYRQV